MKRKEQGDGSGNMQVRPSSTLCDKLHQHYGASI